MAPRGRSAGRAGAGRALDHPLEVAALLWPPPSTVHATRRPGGRGDAAQWLVLPSGARPRLLVPAGVPSAARMLTRHGDRPVPRAARALLALGVSSGLLERLPVRRLRVRAAPDAASLARSLVPHVGDVGAVGVLLGTPRPNRKPVLQVYDAAGRTVAFVKVGHDQHTRELVRREAVNLARVRASGLTGIEPPEVLHVGTSAGLELLVLSPLPASQQGDRAAAAPPPLAAMAELSRSAGVTRAGLAGSALGRRLAQPSSSGSTGERARWAALARVAVDRHGADEIDLGAWHGDWAPWNMGWSEGRLQLWDWERYDEGVPLGWDLVHYLSQRVRHDRPGRAAAEQALLAALPEQLPAVGVAAEHADRTLLLYLLELAGRFLPPTDGADRDHPRARWALDLAERLVHRTAAPR